VQPVLDRYCIECHHGTGGASPDLRGEEHHPDYKGKLLSDLGYNRLHPVIMDATGGYNRYTPAYDALVPLIRRVNVEDDVGLPDPMEYHASTSQLVQMLEKGHHGVQMDRESWERIYTWIDLNGPCHGTWNDVFPVQDGICERRAQLSQEYGHPPLDPDYISRRAVISDPKLPRMKLETPVSDEPDNPGGTGPLPGPGERKETLTVELAEGISLSLVRIPAGAFVPGDPEGTPDEWPGPVTKIDRDFWMSALEITNGQYRLFDPDHSSRYYGKRHDRHDDRGLNLDGEDQPVVRISLKEAEAFCEWLSEHSGITFRLPTEDQWEYACRAGTRTTHSFGKAGDDFSGWANLADRSFGPYLFKSGGVTHFVLEGAALADTTVDDGHVVTAPVGSYGSNPLGLFDMHGNAAEWVIPTRQGPRGIQIDPGQLAVARGGSFFDPPSWTGSASRAFHFTWQKVFDTGFRVVAEPEKSHGSP
jgi:formylglycine-generating enzyme required for sulfatase activity